MKLEGQCTYCENMATIEVLDADMYDYVNVCEDCYKNIFKEVADQGVQVFYDWAEEMFGYRKALGLCEEIFGESALAKIWWDEEIEDGEMVTMFTYGILKYPRNIEFEGGRNVIENCTVKEHKMYLYNNSFPITKMTGNENDIIYGTLFDIPAYVILNQYDLIEGYDPRRHPSKNMYNRIKVEVMIPNGEKKTAQMYYANQEWFKEHLNEDNWIPTGN